MKTRAGDWVEVRSKEEILRTLDKSGRLDGLPFMPQMFNYCGRRFRVHSSAYKTCDTVSGHYVGRSLPDAVHLNMRCDGQAYGGCQAGCLIFWKNAWLKPVEGPVLAKPVPDGDPARSMARNSKTPARIATSGKQPPTKTLAVKRDIPAKQPSCSITPPHSSGGTPGNTWKPTLQAIEPCPDMPGRFLLVLLLCNVGFQRQMGGPCSLVIQPVSGRYWRHPVPPLEREKFR